MLAEANFCPEDEVKLSVEDRVKRALDGVTSVKVPGVGRCQSVESPSDAEPAMGQDNDRSGKKLNSAL